jgi:hypothetical protein
VGVEHVGHQAGVEPDPAQVATRSFAVEYAEPSGRARGPAEGNGGRSGPLRVVQMPGATRIPAAVVPAAVTRFRRGQVGRELGGGLDENDVAGRDGEVVLPGVTFELHLSVMDQRSRGIPLAEPDERGSLLGPALHAEQDPAAGLGISMHVRGHGDGQPSVELFGLEQA